MKILHCADIHLESKMESNLDRDRALKRREELLATFADMVSYADTHDISHILIAGDMFDKQNIRKTAVNYVSEIIATHPHINFYYLRGNHDSGDFDDEILLKAPQNLFLFKDSEWISYDEGEVVITGREMTEANHRFLTVDLVLDPARFNIVMLHGQESDYEGSDKTQVVNLTALSGKFIDYLALGHIHSYKADRLDDRGMYCYPGCLEGRGFDECGTKGFVVLEITDGKCKETFVPFATRCLHEIEVAVSADSTMPILMEEIEQALLDIPEKDMVKVVLRGNTQMEQYIDITRIIRTFEDQFFFFKIYDKTQVKIDYESFLHDRTLKGTFVRLMQKQELSEEEKANIIEIGIRSIMGEEIDV